MPKKQIKVHKHTIFHYFVTVLYSLFKNSIRLVAWLAVGATGYLLFQTKKTPLDIVLGLPLFLIGVGFAINSLWSIVLAIFSPKFNQGTCFFSDLRI